MWQLQIMNIFKKKKDILMQHSWSAFSEKLHKINLSWLNYCYQSQYMDFTRMGGSRLVNCPAAADKPARLWSSCSLALPFFIFIASDILSNKYIEISETAIGCLCCCVFPISHFGICYETADKYKDHNGEKRSAKLGN